MTDLINYLLFIAIRNDIKVVFSEDLDTYTPDLSVPSQRKVIINRNSNNNVSVAFRLAHELSHILFGSVEQNRVYAFSIGATKLSERIAHEQAMHIIAKYVFQDTPVEYRNYINFMESLGLPSYFEDMAREAVMQA